MFFKDLEIGQDFKFSLGYGDTYRRISIKKYAKVDQDGSATDTDSFLCTHPASTEIIPVDDDQKSSPIINEEVKNLQQKRVETLLANRDLIIVDDPCTKQDEYKNLVTSLKNKGLTGFNLYAALVAHYRGYESHNALGVSKAAHNHAKRAKTRSTNCARRASRKTNNRKGK